MDFKINMRVILLLFLSLSLYAAEDIGGFWKTIDDKTGVAQSVIAIYKHQGLYYGRIIGSYDEKGQMKDSIYLPISRSPGLPGNPFYSGLDIIWFLADRGSKFRGKILDPEHGDVYNSELWIDNGNLVVRGKLLMFGRSQVWVATAPADFPKDFKMPDLTAMVPSIPQYK